MSGNSTVKPRDIKNRDGFVVLVVQAVNNQLQGADLSGKKLPGAVLQNEILIQAKFGGSILTQADFSKSNLTQASLVRADLRLRGIRPSVQDMLRWIRTHRGAVRMVPAPTTAVLFQAVGRRR